MRIPLMSWPSLFILACICTCCIHTNPVSSQCLDDQKSLLLQLQTSLEFDHSVSTKLVRWNQNADCCQWSGVKCSKSSGQVIGLDLSSEAISSRIDSSSSLFRFQSLQSLNLAYNPIPGNIPSEFSKLSSLTYLNLSGAYFSGQVPAEISHLVKLVILDMSYSDSLFMKNPSLAMIIQNLTNLRELHLNDVDISANGEEWGKAVSSLPKLQVLTMSNCNLSGDIHQSLAKLQSLSQIRLDENHLAARLPEFVANFRNLTTLTLSNCGLTGTVPRKIFQVPTLAKLDLSYNDMLQGTLPEFLHGQSVQQLTLSHTNFSGLLPHSIGNLKTLQFIDLRECRFSGTIPLSMGSLELLEYVDLSSNSFSGPIPSFSPAKYLTYIELRNNGLNGTITSTDWGGLLNLEYISLEDNSLAGIIPASLFSVPSLREVHLARNHFSGQLNKFAIINPSMLRVLELSSNNLEGPIPESVFQLRSLMTLDLSWNRFNGTLELNEILHRLPNLFLLHLSYNRLSLHTNGTSANTSFPQLESLQLASCNLRALPEFLRSQSYMEKLDLSNNQIDGRVPRWAWQVGKKAGLGYLNLSCNNFMVLEQPLPYIPSLGILDLHSNNFQGPFPIIPSKGALGYLDCSNNNFTSIHPGIGYSLSAAYFFSLSSNNIHGNIPISLCNATNLEVLDLEDNHLKGIIPNCLIAMSQTLGVLNLRGNNLAGFIPDELGKSCTLETLDLNRNYLRGRIPRSLANCRDLKVLDLGNNRLNDTFPCLLKSLSNLQVLVLRSNKFHGTIACPKTNSLWPLVQILDLASNHFSGELPTQYLLSWVSMMAKGTNEVQSKPNHLHYDSEAGEYYQDAVTVTFKGHPFVLPKILKIFTSIDFSDNAFEGGVPKELGNLNALIVLNLSHNSFSGNIPPSLGNLSQLESLDLSCNNLNGNIPRQLADLNFLEYLNLSFNELVGQIPVGTQLQSFDASSYNGNLGLYGPPLTPYARDTPGSVPATSPDGLRYWSSMSEVKWMLRGAEVGFPVAIAIFVGSLLYIKRWRRWYSKHLDTLVMKMLRREDHASGRGKKQRKRHQRQN